MTEQVADHTVTTPGMATAVRWVDRVGLGNLALTVVLSVAGALVVLDPRNGGGPAAVAIVQLCLWPLLAMRAAPVAASVAVAMGALLTQLAVGPIVTCSVVLPVLFAMTFQLGSRAWLTRLQLAAALMGISAAATVQVLMDPALDSEAAVFFAGLALGFFFAGRLLRSRDRMIDLLRLQTRQLAAQRDRTAQLAVEADRERIGADLELSVRSHIRTIVEAAGQGRSGAQGSDSAEASRAALVEVELQGRETLASMRDVVGTLHDAPTQPPPGIAELSGLLRRATTADARMRVEGIPRTLSPNLELCAYRIVEQLLGSLSDHPRARVDVVLRFHAEALQIGLSGPVRDVPDPAGEAAVVAALEAARARAQVIGGRLVEASPDGRRQINVVLPVPAAILP